MFQIKLKHFSNLYKFVRFDVSAYWLLNKLQFKSPDDFKANIHHFNNGVFDFDSFIPEPSVRLDYIGDDYIEEALYYFLSDRLANKLPSDVIDKYFNIGQFYIQREHYAYYQHKVEELLNHYSSYKYEDAAKDLLFNRGKNIASLVDEYGCQDRKQWRLKHWGTAQNAFNVNFLDNGILFNTKFSPPSMIIKKLAEMTNLEGTFSVKGYFIEFDIEFKEGKVVSDNSKVIF